MKIKAIKLIFGIIGAIVVSGCKTDTNIESLPTLSEYAQPVQFKVYNAIATSQALKFFCGITLPDLLTSGGPAGTEYNGRVENSYVNRSPENGNLFIIVDFNISGVTKKTQLVPSDVLVRDGAGVEHAAIGRLWPDKTWHPVDRLIISTNIGETEKLISLFENDPANNNTMAVLFGSSARERERWIFDVHRDAVKGSQLCFQGKQYQLDIQYPIVDIQY